MSRKALSQSATLRYVSFAALYISESIPNSFIMICLTAWLATKGKSPMEISGIIAIMILPWSLKVFIAPLIDRYTYLPMGLKRPWIIGSQLCMCICLMSLYFIKDPIHHIKLLTGIVFFLGLFGAAQDLAIDGMAVEIIPADQQAKANGVMWGAATLGFSLNSYVGTVFINHLGFNNAVAIMTLFVVIIMIFPIFFLERPNDKFMPWSKSNSIIETQNIVVKSWKELFLDLWFVIRQPTNIVLTITLFIVGIINGISDTTIFTIQKLNWSNADYTLMISITGIIGAIFGMTICGFIADKYGDKNVLILYLGLMFIFELAFALMPNIWHLRSIIYWSNAISAILLTFIIIVQNAMAMTFSYKKIAAVQFALFMSISNLGITLGKWLLGVLKDRMDWQPLFIIIAFLPLIAIPFVAILKKSKSEEAPTEVPNDIIYLNINNE